MKLAILLTATVKVQVVGGNFNMEERAAMYASTLRYYADSDRQEISNCIFGEFGL